MEFFDDDIISNMNEMNIKKKPNIFDDLLEDEEIEQVNKDDEIFPGDKGRISSYSKEQIWIENENKAEEIIFRIEKETGKIEEELEDEIEVEVEVDLMGKERMSDSFGMVERLDFQDFSGNLSKNEFDDDFDIDDRFEDNDNVFLFSKFSKNMNENDKEELLFKRETYSKQVGNEVIKEKNISNNLFELNQVNKEELNVEEEGLKYENLVLNNNQITSHNIQNDKLSETQTNSTYSATYCDLNKEKQLTFIEKTENETSETNVLNDHFSNNSEEEMAHSSVNNNETYKISNKATESNYLQSSIKDINWNRVWEIIENFEEQTGNTGKNQILFKSIIYKLSNDFNNSNNNGRVHDCYYGAKSEK